MSQSYHRQCCRASPIPQKTAFKCSQTKQYVRSHYKNDGSSHALLNWGSSTHTQNYHVNAHFRIPKANK